MLLHVICVPLKFRIPICIDKFVSRLQHVTFYRGASKTKYLHHRRPGDLWRVTRRVVSQIVSHWFSGRVAGTAPRPLPTRDVFANALWFPGAYLCTARRFRPFRLTFRAVDSLDFVVTWRSRSVEVDAPRLSADFYRKQILQILNLTPLRLYKFY